MFTQATKQNENGKAAADLKQVQQKEQNGFAMSRKNSSFPGSVQSKRSSANSSWSISQSKFSRPSKIQCKVKIGKPNDKYEKEADAMADKVMSMPAKTQSISNGEQPGSVSRKPETSLLSKITPLTQRKEEELQNKEEDLQEKTQSAIQSKSIAAGTETPPASVQRACNECSSSEDVQSKIQTMADEAQTQNLQSQIDSASTPNIQAESSSETARGPPDSFESSLNSSKGGGSPLPDETQRDMGSSFGADFSNVRVHTDSNAVQMNKQVGAQAFAHGSDIYFNEGKYSPGSSSGKRLLAHELTHTIQQGAVVRPYRAQMKAEETGPIVQRAGPNPLAVEKEEIDKDKGIEKAVQARAGPNFLSAPVMVQGGWLGDKLNEYASDIPGWTLITVVVGYNPLTERDIERTPQNFLKGLMGLVPGGNALYEKLEEHNLISDAFTWLNQQLSDLDLSWRRVAREMEEAWDEMSIRYSFSTNLGIVKDHLYSIYRDVKEFGKRIIDKTIELVKKAILVPLGEYIRDNTRAWPLVTVLLGEDPISGEKVERNLYNIASGFLMLDPDGEAYLNKLNESGKLQELSDWFDAEVEKLNVNADTISQVFSDAWDLITLDNLLEPIDTFKKIFDLFYGPFERIINFVIAVAMKILTAIKDWLIAQLKEHAHKVPGYPLLTVILGKDPVTQEEVPRTAENFIKGFMSFVPGGLEKFENLKKSGAIDKAFAWLEKAVAKLNLSFEAFLQLFVDLWESFTINDLLDPIGAFEKIINIFAAPVLRIIDFAIEVGLKVLEFVFTGVMGSTGARVVNILKKGRSTFLKIIKDPVKFLGNLLKALAKGFKQFADNILKHLLNGLIGWLFGALEGAGIKLPEKFDLKGVVSLVLQILGITWERMRIKLVKKLGERKVKALEKAFDFIKLIITEGIAGVWRKIMEYITGLKDKVMDGIRDWVITKIVTIAIQKLATMTNPVGAVIESILVIYNTVMFFIERLNQILDLVEAVVNSVANIAAGKLDDAANYVEEAMGRTVPVIISFLARLIGLGGISAAIKKVIGKVQDVVDKGIDKLINWIVKQVKNLVKKGKAGFEALLKWAGIKKGFTAGNNKKESHELYFKGKQLIMASNNPKPVKEHIEDVKAFFEEAKGVSPEDKLKLAQTVDKAIKQASKIATLRSKARNDDTLSEDEKKKTLEELSKLTQDLKVLWTSYLDLKVGESDIPQSVVKYYGTKGEMGRTAEARVLTIKPPEEGKGSEPHGAPSKTNIWKALQPARETKGGSRSKYILGHLLNGKMHGPGNKLENIAPIPQGGNNDHNTQVEEKVKEYVFARDGKNEELNWVYYRVEAKYDGDRSKVTETLAKFNETNNSEVAQNYSSEVARVTAKKVLEAEMQVPTSFICKAELRDTKNKTIQAIPIAGEISFEIGGWPHLKEGSSVTETEVSILKKWTESAFKPYGIVGNYAIRLAAASKSSAQDFQSRMWEIYTARKENSRYKEHIEKIKGDWAILVSVAKEEPESGTAKIIDLNLSLNIDGFIKQKTQADTIEAPVITITKEQYELNVNEAAHFIKENENSHDHTANYFKAKKQILKQLTEKAAKSLWEQNKDSDSKDNWYKAEHKVKEHLQNLGIQPKLQLYTNSWNSDPHEQQADRVADIIVAGNTTAPLAPSISSVKGKQQAKCAACEKEEKGSGLDVQLNSSKGGGNRMDKKTRREMENGFGANFSKVRIHTGSQAEKMCTQIGARAFTYGNDIYFNSGQYNPQSREGKHLLAHELTHTVQQGAAKPKVQKQGNQTRGSPACDCQSKDDGTQQSIQRRAGPEVSQTSGGPFVQRGLWDSITGAAGAVWDSTAGAVVNAAGEVISMTRDMFWSLLNRVAPASLVSLVREISGKGIFGFLKEKITSSLSSIFSGLTGNNEALQTLFETFGHFSENIITIIGALAGGDCKPLFAALDSFKGIVSGIAGDAWNGIKNFFAPVGKFFSDLWTNFGAPVLDWLKETATDVWSYIKGLGQQIWDWTSPVRSAAASAWDWLKDTIGIGSEDGDSSGGIIGWIKGKAQEVWDSVKQELSPIIEPVMQVANKIKEFLPLTAIINLKEKALNWSNKINHMGQQMSGDDNGMNAEGQASLRGEILPAVMETVNTLSLSIGSAGVWLSNVIGDISTKVNGFIGTLTSVPLLAPLRAGINWLKERADAIAAWAREKVIVLFKKIGEGLKYLSSFIEPILNVLQKIAEVLGDLLGKLPDLILGPFWWILPACIKNPIKDFFIKTILTQIPFFGQLVAVGDIWTKVQSTALTILTQIFVDGDLFMAIWTFFKSMLSLIGIPPELVTNIIVKASQAFTDILSDPVGFIINILRSVKLGFSNFFSNILRHLAGGVVDWLFGQVAEAGIEIPQDFSLRSILKFVFDILGISIDKIWRLLEEKIGREKVERLRRYIRFATGVFEWVVVAMTEGPAGVWNRLVSQLNNIWSIVIGQVVNFISTRIIARATQWIMSLLDVSGITPVINSLIAVWNAVQSFAQNVTRILRIINSVVNGIADMAAGNIEPAAGYLEGALAGAIPVIISFLAGQFGLNSIGSRMRSIIGSVQRRVEDALRWLINRTVDGIRNIAAYIRSLAARGGAAVRRGANSVRNALFPRKRFRVGRESHTLHVRSGTRPTLMIASTPQPVVTFLNNLRSNDRVPQDKKALIPGVIAKANTLQGLIDLADRDKSAGRDVTEQMQTILEKENQMANDIRTIWDYQDPMETIEKYRLEGTVATYGTMPRARFDRLTPDHQPQASILRYAARLPEFAGAHIQQVVRGSHVDGGAAINLFDKRHEAGRTYGSKGNSTSQEAQTEIESRRSRLPANDYEGKRNVVVAVLRSELQKDVSAMNRVANSDDSYADINGVQNLTDDGKRELKNSIKSRILAGENRINYQNLDRLKNGGPQNSE